MAIEKTIILNADAEQANAEINKLDQNLQDTDKSANKLNDSAKNLDSGFKGVGKAVRGVGTALKALGIGAIIALVAKFTDALGKNQAVVDFFSTSLETVSRIFNDIVEAILDFEKTWARVKNFFTELIEDPKKAINELTQATREYVKETIDAAKAVTELENVTKLATAQNNLLLQQYDQQAERLRQIRDDERKTIQERIEANEKLALVLEDQSAKMLANADMQIKLAQTNLAENENIENRVALIEALTERQDILATIEGLRSEQLVNQAALEKELIEGRQVESIELKQKEIDFKITADQKELTSFLEKENLKKQIEQESSEARILMAEKEALAKEAAFDATATALTNLSLIAGKETAAGKALAIAASLINTYQGITKSLAVGGFLGIAQAVAVGAAGFAAVKNIISTPVPNEGGISSPVSSVPAPPQIQQPSFNILGSSGVNQIADAINTKPIKTFVTTKDVSTGQELERNIVKSATL